MPPCSESGSTSQAFNCFQNENEYKKILVSHLTCLTSEPSQWNWQLRFNKTEKYPVGMLNLFQALLCYKSTRPTAKQGQRCLIWSAWI